MEQVINIHNKGIEIEFEVGKYKIDVLGGWGVNLGQFSIALKHKLNGQMAECERSFWRIQSVVHGKRAKRIFEVQISLPGIYELAFSEPTTLQVKETNLFFSRLLQKPLPNETICIYIH